MVILFIIITTIFLLYIQFSPQMGNVWWRENYFSPMGAINVILYPLKEVKMWNINMWDINYFIWLLFFYALTFIFLSKFSFFCM